MPADEPSTHSASAIGVVDPVSSAVNSVGAILFQNAPTGRWLSLGFCAFLIALGKDGAGIYSQLGNLSLGFVNVPMSAPPAGGLDPLAQDARPQDLPVMLKNQADGALQGLQDNLPAILAGAAVLALLYGTVWLAFQWLGARGRFMFLDNVANCRELVKQPWREYRREANSLFVLNLLLGAIAFLGAGAILAGMLWTAWPDVAAKRFGEAAQQSLWIFVPTLLLWMLFSRVLHFIAEQLLPPVMYLRRVGWLAAAGIFRREILAGNWGRLLLLFLFSELLLIGVGSVASLIACVTCCMSSMPFIGQVVMLPLSTFLQAYYLHYLEQFGPQWRFFARPETTMSVG